MMRISQLLGIFIAASLVTLSPQTFAQDYTPSDAVNEAIVDAQADGVITDAEAASLAQTIAADGGDAAAVATTLNNNGASSVQVAAGLAAVGQSQAQIAATLVATNVTSQADAQTTAQAGQQAAVATGNVTVVTNATQAAAVAANLQITGSGLITDSTGKAVVVQNAGDQLLLVREIIRTNGLNNPDGSAFSTPMVNAIGNIMRTALASLGVTNQAVVEDALDQLQDELDYVNYVGADQLTDDFLGRAFDTLLGSVEEATGQDLNNDGGVGDSPNSIT